MSFAFQQRKREGVREKYLRDFSSSKMSQLPALIDKLSTSEMENIYVDVKV